MIDQKTKQEISNALKVLNETNTSRKIDAIKRLGEIGVYHPQIIERLQFLISNDTSTDVRAVAQNTINSLQNISNSGNSSPTQVSSDETTLDTENAILDMLQKQNEILKNIRTLIAHSLEKENETAYHFRSRVTDLDLSIGSMISLSFKWLIASIPVAIVLGFTLIFFQACAY